jgi:hypothetical protein
MGATQNNSSPENYNLRKNFAPWPKLSDTRSVLHSSASFRFHFRLEFLASIYFIFASRYSDIISQESCDRTAGIAGTKQPGQDSRDKTAGTRQPGHDS